MSAGAKEWEVRGGVHKLAFGLARLQEVQVNNFVGLSEGLHRTAVQETCVLEAQTCLLPATPLSLQATLSRGIEGSP